MSEAARSRLRLRLRLPLPLPLPLPLLLSRFLRLLLLRRLSRPLRLSLLLLRRLSRPLRLSLLLLRRLSRPLSRFLLLLRPRRLLHLACRWRPGSPRSLPRLLNASQGSVRVSQGSVGVSQGSARVRTAWASDLFASALGCHSVLSL